MKVRAEPAKRITTLQKELTRVIPFFREIKAKKVYLFSSLARGDAGSRSDLDLIIIKNTELPFLARLEEVYTVFQPEIAMDILVYTPLELQKMMISNSFIIKASKEWKLIYES